MGFEKKTIKIIVIVTVVIVLIGTVLGLVLGLLLNQRYVDLEVWPRSEQSYNWEEPLIDFKAEDPGSWNVWVTRINSFLSAYETSVPETPARAPCSVRGMEHGMGTGMRHFGCEQAMRAWFPCTIDNYYGYPYGKPCVFLRLSNLHYWVPEPYNTSTHLSLPPDMPEKIRTYMHTWPAHQHGDFIWVSCEGEFSSDKENIGPIQYIPAEVPPGFPTSRLHTADRIPRAARTLRDTDPGPLVAVYFENPRRGVLINVECRIWSRDIYYDRSSRIGRTRFELYVN